MSLNTSELNDKATIIAILLAMLFLVGIFNNVPIVELAYLSIFFIVISIISIILLKEIGGWF